MCFDVKKTVNIFHNRLYFILFYDLNISRVHPALQTIGMGAVRVMNDVEDTFSQYPWTLQEQFSTFLRVEEEF